MLSGGMGVHNSKVEVGKVKLPKKPAATASIRNKSQYEHNHKTVSPRLEGMQWSKMKLDPQKLPSWERAA
jgi:hypothetical protein